MIPRFGENNKSPVFFAKDKAFFLFAYERLQTGNAASPGGITTPTAAGFSIINSIPGLSAINRGIFNQFTPVASTNELTKRLSYGLTGSAAYTLSHLIDDSTAEVFSTVLSPRRAENFQNIRAERADSALDHRHRFVTALVYDLPFFNKSENRFARTLLGGFRFAGTYTFESGEKATVRSGIDSNLNGDSAGDRAIINPNGVRNTASTVTALRNTAGDIVGYLANNPNAQYIQAGLGAVTNSPRNTLQLPPINNLDFSIFKNFSLGEVRKIQIRADMFNAFNHPQYIPGSPNDVSPNATTGVAGIAQIGSATFNRPSAVFSSNPRVVQLALRFDF